jgi:hypothetical protein
MAAADVSEDQVRGGISPDQARADFLEKQIEQVRRALEPLIDEENIEPRLRRAWSVLEKLPPRD